MPDASVSFTVVFVALLLTGLLVRFYLASRQIRHVMRHRGVVPPAFASTISLTAHQKAADYTVTKARFGLLEMAFGAAVLLGWTLLGGIDTVNQLLADSALAQHGTLVSELALHQQSA
jgi:STE24 endopeptidase